MARARRHRAQAQAPEPPWAAAPRVWLRARYACHVFHYRMPETVAIAAVNPVVPSPLTVKMAIVAALLRGGRVEEARQVTPALPTMRVLISPPQAALVFRALMRYVRPPADRTTTAIDANTGGRYGANPHNREFALWGGGDGRGLLTVLVETPEPLADAVAWALEQVPYLGSKDSLVTCTGVERLAHDPQDVPLCRSIGREEPPPKEFGNYVVRLADFRADARVSLETVIPARRNRRDYLSGDEGLHVLPGEVLTSGRVKLYWRDTGAE